MRHNFLETCNTAVVLRKPTTCRIESYIRHVVCRIFTVNDFFMKSYVVGLLPFVQDVVYRIVSYIFIIFWNNCRRSFRLIWRSSQAKNRNVWNFLGSFFFCFCSLSVSLFSKPGLPDGKFIGHFYLIWPILEGDGKKKKFLAMNKFLAIFKIYSNWWNLYLWIPLIWFYKFGLSLVT